MSDPGTWITWLLIGALKLQGPTLAEPEMIAITGRDPSWEIYEDYRYAYENYGYLFLTEEEGMEILEDTGMSAADQAAEGVIPAGEPGAGVQYGLEQLDDYDMVMKQFYSVHSSAAAGPDLINARAFAEKNMQIEKDPNVPQILIYHTHSQEAYADYGPGNTQATVVEAGNYLTELLEAKGWNVIHDTSAYDIQGGELDRNRAYTYALQGISGILEQNPSIQVVLDVHRDGVAEGLRLVSEVNGKTTARIMFFQGTSRTPDGPIEYLPNPYFADNMAFSFQMQLMAARDYPGLTRKIYLKGLRYNLHVRPRASLIELGAQTNTWQEARNAVEPLAELLDRVLQGN